LKRRYIDKRVDPDDTEDTQARAQSRVFIRAKLEDNPSLNQAAYRESLAALEPEVRAQLLNGDWDARQPGDWYFDEAHLSAVAQLGREYRDRLNAGELYPSDDVVNLGIDFGESTHAVLGLPLPGGGLFIAREHVSYGRETGEKSRAILALNDLGYPWGRVRFDAAGIGAMRTFIKVAEESLGDQRPRAWTEKDAKVAFGRYKGEACQYIRRMARLASEGSPEGFLAISPECPVLLDQLRRIEKNSEDPQGAWLKADEQHGPDAVVCLAAPLARKFAAAVEDIRQRVYR
jgi:hypothetical protein